MARLSEDQLEKLWRAGPTLTNAWLAYAHPDLKKQWTELEGKSAIAALSESVERAGQQEKPESHGSVEFIQNLLQPAQAILEARSDLKKKMQSNIRDYMKNGYAFAFGFEPPRKLVSVPVELPKDIWRGKFHWDTSTIDYAGLSFVQVRLTTRRIREEILALHNAPPIPSAPSRGRPSVAQHISAAGQALLMAGHIDVSQSAKSHYPAIRRWLADNAGGLPVASDDIHDETIRLVFAPIFNELKKTKKQ